MTLSYTLAYQEIIQWVLQGVRFLLANNTLLSGTSESESYSGILWPTLAYFCILLHTLAYRDMLWHTLAYSGIIIASLITADGAYHCPVGSIWPFFLSLGYYSASVFGISNFFGFC